VFHLGWPPSCYFLRFSPCWCCGCPFQLRHFP
jgi:hypothetical protein